MNRKVVLLALLTSSIHGILTPSVFASADNEDLLRSPISGRYIKDIPNSPVVKVPVANTSRLGAIMKAINDEKDAKLKLITQIEELKSKLQQLQNDYSNALKNIQTLELSISEKDKEIESIKNTIESKNKELEHKISELDSSKEGNKDLENSIEVLKNEQKELENKLNVIGKEKETLVIDLDKITKESEELKKNLDSTTSKLNDVQKQNKDLQGAIVYAKIKQSLGESLKTSLDLYKQKEQHVLDVLQGLTKNDFESIDNKNAEQISVILNTALIQLEKNFSDFFSDRFESINEKIEKRRANILKDQAEGKTEELIFSNLKNDAESSLIKDCSLFSSEKELWKILSGTFSIFKIQLQPVESIDFSKLIKGYEDLIKHRSNDLSLTEIKQNEEKSPESVLMDGIKKRSKSKK